MHRNLSVLAALVTGLGSLLAQAGTSGAQENPVTAIDIALEPDATMIQHAEAANSVYQLGNFGTARKELIAWGLKP
jgi:hypothetical protein